uniref:Uncharacterized protein n=1 Tax=Canis lupus familiaris TaxID=9615 RepID=A0A8C0LY46_CANLF
HSFSLLSFLGRLGDFASSSCLLVHCFDNTHSNHLSHVTNSKTAQRRIVREALDTHRFARNHINNGSIPRFQELGTIFHWWVIFAVNSHIATTNIFDRYVLHIEAHIVPRKSLTQSFMVYFSQLNFSCNIDWSKGDHHARLKNTSLHLTHGDSTNTTNFVDVPERQKQGLISWDELVAECNPELQAVWFHWHSHLYT